MIRRLGLSAMQKYITADDLAAIIKSGKKPMKDFVVVDVRDDDFRGGNIKGCVNMPSEKFSDTVEDLVEKTKAVPMVVFHCALSQQRGPKSARIYANSRLLAEGGADIEHEVCVLRGGFTEFQEKFKDDPDLVENWDKRTWNTDYFNVL